ncbi:FBXW7 protein, partial [Columbina picui]|nr:FBXW7 protein [Columbina picui]
CRVVSGSRDATLRLWDIETGQCLHVLMGHVAAVRCVQYDGHKVVSGAYDYTVKVWDPESESCTHTLQGHTNRHQSAVTCLQFSSKFVVTSSDDGTVKLWDLKTGEFVRNLVALESGGSGGVVWRIRASNTKLVCAVGSRNGTEETKLLVLDFDVDLK